MTEENERRFFSGNPRIRLAPDEIYFFDLYIEPEHRRGGLAWTMADLMFRTYDPAVNPKACGYSFVEIENSTSFMWHHSIGFNIMQSVNMFMFGPRIKWRLPFSDMPRFGPFSRKGRFSDPRPLFGPSIMPINVPPISDDPDVRLRRKREEPAAGGDEDRSSMARSSASGADPHGGPRGSWCVRRRRPPQRWSPRLGQWVVVATCRAPCRGHRVVQQVVDDVS